MLLLLSLVLLVALIAWLRVSAFIALFITALITGLLAGMSPAAVATAAQNGAGSTLGGVVLVLGLGMVLGNLLTASGAMQVIAERLLAALGERRAGWALAGTAFVVGLAMFYNAGFVVLAPLVFSVHRRTGQSLVPLSIAMAAPLSVTHGFLPPHPGATAVANLLHADLGRTLLLGLVLAVPTLAIAALWFPSRLLHLTATPPASSSVWVEKAPELATPRFGVSLLLALLPVLLMALATVAELALPEGHVWRYWLKFAGDSGVAMLTAVLAAWVVLFVLPRQNPAKALEQAISGLGPLPNLLLIIAAGGAFKQILTESGLAQGLGSALAGLPLSPLLLGWGMATVLRIAIGSATVAGMTAAGLVVPLVTQGGASPELMTLAVGAGSLMCSHVNDSGFWMFREWFGLSVRDTFSSWTVMETIVGVAGLVGVLVLDWVV